MAEWHKWHLACKNMCQLFAKALFQKSQGTKRRAIGQSRFTRKMAVKAKVVVVVYINSY